MSHGHEVNVLATYRSLRIAMIPLLLILVVATVLETLRGEVCVLGSISAYFHTPVRGAFVAALAGLGACLIAYKGNDPLENVLLDFAGFMAFLVALVPTTIDTTCATTGKYAGVVPDANTADAVRNNVLTLILMVLLAVGLNLLMPRLVEARRRRTGGASAAAPVPEPVPLVLTADDEKARKLARIWGLVALVIVLVELAMFGFLPETFKDVAHGISAITMVLGVLGVMIANARGFARATQGVDDPPVRHWRNRYTAVAGATVAAIIVAILVFRTGSHLILVLELVVIFGFIVFWFMQTRELWDFPTREEKTRKVEEVLREQEREAVPAPGGGPEREPAGPRDRGLPGEPEEGQPVPGEAPPAPAEPAPTSRGDVYESL